MGVAETLRFALDDRDRNDKDCNIKSVDFHHIEKHQSGVIIFFTAIEVFLPYRLLIYIQRVALSLFGFSGKCIASDFCSALLHSYGCSLCKGAIEVGVAFLVGG